MKLISFKDKIEGQILEEAWINICKIKSGNITENLKPIQLGYFFGFFIPFTKKIRLYTSPNSFLLRRGLTIKRVGIRFRRPNTPSTNNGKMIFSKCIVNYPLENDK